MPFALSASNGVTTLSLTDGNPYSLEGMSGGGAPDVMRLGERGPLQNGVSDLGYRVGPRTVTLAILFNATSASLLDTRRSALAALLAPFESVPITLTVTRDDGTTRTLQCNTIAGTDIEIVPLHRPGNLHRAVVQLRAVTPYWSGSVVSYNLRTPNDISGNLFVYAERTIVNPGDVPVGPLVTIVGYMSNVIFSNLTTGESINLLGVIIGSAAAAQLDFRSGYKTFSAGTSLLPGLSYPHQLTNFRLLPGSNSVRAKIDTLDVPTTDTYNVTYNINVTYAFVPQYLSY